MTLLKNQVVQAQCPGCGSKLKIPAGWVGQAMRCKHCKLEFQAQAPEAPKGKSLLARALRRKKKKRDKTSPVMAAKPHTPPAAIPVGAPVDKVTGKMKAPALPVAAPVGAPARIDPYQSNPMRRRGGKQKLAFVLVFLLAIGGLAAVIYSVAKEPIDTSLVAEADMDKDPFGDKTKKKVLNLIRPMPPKANQTSVKTNVPPPRLPTRPRKGPPVKATRIVRPTPPPRQPPTRPPFNGMPNRPPVTQPPRTMPIPPSSVPSTMPRRLFAVVPSSYYYANPVGTGSDVGSALYRFAEVLRVPSNQMTVVSDRPVGAFKPAPPIKPVIDLNMTNFLNTSRPYDRIVVLFVGHAVEVEGVPYLMPLEGEKDDAENLIPLEWMYEKVAQCSARQKIIVLDVCRFNPARGEEFGEVAPMGPMFDLMLQNPPPGVQVLTACTAGQRSYELSSNADKFQVQGGIMLNALNEPRLKSTMASAGANPEDSIPIQSLARLLNIRTKRMAEFFKLDTAQTPRLSGDELDTSLAHDADADPAERVNVELAGIFTEGVASKAEIQAMFKEIAGLPTVKHDNDPSSQLNLDNLPPFAKETLKPYIDDGKDSVIRATVRDSLNLLRKDNARLTMKFNAPAANQETNFKNGLEGVQKRVSLTQYNLAVILDELKMLSDDRDKEPKGWQALYDYTCARLEYRIAYLHEYNAKLGDMRKMFPERDPAIHIGWQMASIARIGDRDARKNQRNASKYLDKLAEEHGGTPWAMLAKREKVTSLGLEWVPLAR